jgi:hypothetical protein
MYVKMYLNFRYTEQIKLDVIHRTVRATIRLAVCESCSCR